MGAALRLSTHHNSSRGDPDRDTLRNRTERRLRLNPRRWDTDRDGLSDGVEVRKTKTNPRRKDTDKDGVPDGREVGAGSNPRDSSSRPGSGGGSAPPGEASTLLPEDPRPLAGVVKGPIDSHQQTWLGFGDRVALAPAVARLPRHPPGDDAPRRRSGSTSTTPSRHLRRPRLLASWRPAASSARATRSAGGRSTTTIPAGCAISPTSGPR